MPHRPYKIGLFGAFVFALNLACAQAAFISISTAPNPPSENLTLGGLTDWGHWGLTSATDFNSKVTGTILSDTTVVGGGSKLQGTDYNTVFSWTDGTPTLIGGPTPNFQFNNNFDVIGQGLSITLSNFLIPTTGELRLFATVFDGTGTLNVSGSNGGAAFSSIVSAPAANSRTIFEVDFIVAAGETLTATFTLAADSGGSAFSNTGLAAAEVNAIPVAPIPEPATWFSCLAVVLLLCGCEAGRRLRRTHSPLS